MRTRGAFLKQARACEAMGSPFTARLCRLLARRLEPGNPVSDLVLDWPGDPEGRAGALPLRLTGALNNLVLADADAGLVAVYPPNDVRASDSELWMAVSAALVRHETEILERLKSPPQTNEPMRSAALSPGFLTISALTVLPLVISELGASAGLNMVWDRFDYRFGPVPWGRYQSPVVLRPDWTGPTPPLRPARVVERAGCDRAPIDLDDAAARRRLLSFVWPDQTHRVERTAAAIALARAEPERVEAAEAPAWLERRLSDVRRGRVHVIYHSVFWQYLEPQEQQQCEALLRAAGEAATHHAPLAWLRMEGSAKEPDAALTLTLWPEGKTQEVGRADFHGRWVRWTGWH